MFWVSPGPKKQKKKTIAIAMGWSQAQPAQSILGQGVFDKIRFYVNLFFFILLLC
jgi:hypothetical protein